MMKMFALSVATLVGAAQLVFASGTAGAAPVAARCDAPSSSSPGEFCLYYNSYLGGSMRDFDWNVRDLAPYKFRTSGAGYGRTVKNNAASAWNRDPYCKVRVYYNSNYSGPADDVPPNSWRNLSDTKNENASFRWICPWNASATTVR